MRTNPHLELIMAQTKTLALMTSKKLTKNFGHTVLYITPTTFKDDFFLIILTIPSRGKSLQMDC